MASGADAQPRSSHASSITDGGGAAMASQAVLDAVESVRPGTPVNNP